LAQLPKANQQTDLTQRTGPDPLISDISVDSLIGDGLLALHREIKNLLIFSARGKLDPASARDLRDHVKLLFEIKDRENDLLKSLTDEQLRALINKLKEAPSEGRPVIED
jgi:hypothetical protein